jgi:Na+/melibiose symporter-like transporter
MEQIAAAAVEKLDGFQAFIVIIMVMTLLLLWKIAKDTMKRVELRTEQIANITGRQDEQDKQMNGLLKNFDEIFRRLHEMNSQLSQLIGKCDAMHKKEVVYVKGDKNP